MLTGLGNPFQTGSDVHPITKDVAILYDNITDIDTYPQLDAPGFRRGSNIALRPSHAEYQWRSERRRLHWGIQ